MSISCLTRQLTFCAIAIATMVMVSGTCEARGWGCWGGSWGGSWGCRGYSAGSYGCYGGFRTPVRNFFAHRRAIRHARWGSHGCWGCYGGYGSGGYASAGYACGGSWGSYGSVGYASTGYASTGYSYYGGTTYVSAPVVQQTYNTHSSACPGCVVGGTSGVTYGNGTFSQSTIPYAEGTVIPSQGTVIPSDSSLIPAEQYYDSNGSAIPTETPSSRIETPPTPEPEGDGTTSIRKRRSDAILNVDVPLDAKVYVNDRLTTTGGTFRSYVSRKLKRGRNYEFHVKAVANRNGKEVSLDRTVVMRSGKTETVHFDFDKPVLTQLTVKVPENARVKLCGNETKAKGDTRSFKTRLMPGQVWEQYDIDVSYDRDGKVVTEKRTISIEAGQKYVVDFGADNDLYVSK